MRMTTDFILASKCETSISVRHQGPGTVVGTGHTITNMGMRMRARNSTGAGGSTGAGRSTGAGKSTGAGQTPPSQWKWGVALILVLCVSGLLALLVSRQRGPDLPEVASAPKRADATEPITKDRSPGVKAMAFEARGDDLVFQRVVPDVDPIDPDLNEETRSISEGIREGLPQRLSLEFSGPPFDPDRYAEDPESYLKTFEPSRALRPAAAGPDVPVIASTASPQTELAQGESVRLVASLPASTPVTFTSLNGGRFQNDLPSITVAADADGNATVEFTASASAASRVMIMAASPVASGKLRYNIGVLGR